MRLGHASRKPGSRAWLPHFTIGILQSVGRLPMKRNVRVPCESEIVSGDTPCYYCGMLATTIDHVPPKVVRAKFQSLGMMDRYSIHEVPACAECNSLLGDRHPWTLGDRKRSVKNRLRRRYKRILSIPPWSDSELSILSPSLQDFVIRGLYQQEIVLKRLAW